MSTNLGIWTLQGRQNHWANGASQQPSGSEGRPRSRLVSHTHSHHRLAHLFVKRADFGVEKLFSGWVAQRHISMPIFSRFVIKLGSRGTEDGVRRCEHRGRHSIRAIGVSKRRIFGGACWKVNSFHLVMIGEVRRQKDGWFVSFSINRAFWRERRRVYCAQSWWWISSNYNGVLRFHNSGHCT